MKVIDAALIKLPGVEALRRSIALAFELCLCDFGLDGSGNDLGDFILDGEDVLQVAVVSFRP